MTLLSATMVGEGDARTGSLAAIFFAPGGNCGAAVVWRDSTGVASTTREAKVKGAGLEAAVLKDRDAGPPAAIAGEGSGAAEVFFAAPIFFFVLISAVEGGGGEGATGAAGA